MPRYASASFPALGTTALVAVAVPERLELAVVLLRDELAAFDRACSRFRDDSELSRVNAAAGREVGIGPVLADAVHVALDAARRTGGAVDPTVGGTMRALGYDRDLTVVRADGSVGVLRPAPAPGWADVRLDEERGTLRLPPGVTLDLGATAKALAADRAATRIARASGAACLVSLGGDIAVAGDAPAGGWPVRVTDDHRDTEGEGQTVAIAAGGLATSSTTVRRWVAGDVPIHHIVDPSAGLPADVVWRTVTVAAPTCVEANTASTAAVVRGRAAPAWLVREGLAARLVAADGAVLALGGWPPEEAP